MKWLRRIRATLRGEKRRRELQEELQFHLAMREQRYVDAGVKPEEARRRARVRFGNPVVWREKVSAVDLLLFPQTILQDLRFGIRILLRNPGFTAVAVFALAIGIGINTATFTAYQAFFARKIEARDPARMANLALIEQNGQTDPEFSYPDYEMYRNDLHSFSGVIATSLPLFLTLRARGGVVQHGDAGDGSMIGKLGLLPPDIDREMAMALMVSDNYFRVLGMAPIRGRSLESGSASSPSVLISENYWHKRFGDDPSILGKSVVLNGVPFTIIGITPHNFVGTFVSAPDFWMLLKDEPRIHPENSWLQDREKVCCHVRGSGSRHQPARGSGGADAGSESGGDAARSAFGTCAAGAWAGVAGITIPSAAGRESQPANLNGVRYRRGGTGAGGGLCQCGRAADGACGGPAERTRHAPVTGRN